MNNSFTTANLESVIDVFFTNLENKLDKKANVGFDFDLSNLEKVYDKSKRKYFYRINYVVEDMRRDIWVYISINNRTHKFDIETTFSQFDDNLDEFKEMVVLKDSINPFYLVDMANTSNKILNMTNFLFNKYLIK